MAYYAEEDLVKILPPYLVTRAHEWWKELPETYKGRCSIWVILALFADHENRMRELPH